MADDVRRIWHRGAFAVSNLERGPWRVCPVPGAVVVTATLCPKSETITPTIPAFESRVGSGRSGHEGAARAK